MKISISNHSYQINREQPRDDLPSSVLVIMFSLLDFRLSDSCVFFLENPLLNEDRRDRVLLDRRGTMSMLLAVINFCSAFCSRRDE
jgi:hypothetical protein